MTEPKKHFDGNKGKQTQTGNMKVLQEAARRLNGKDIWRHKISIVSAFNHLSLQKALIRLFRLAAPYLPVSLR